MTAVNAFIGRDHAFMLTDASMYTAQGVIMGFGQKAVAIPTIRAAIASRGVQKVTALLAMELSLFPSFDALLDNAEFALRRYHEQNLLALSGYGAQDINIVVIGWSEEADAPKGFCFDSTSDTFEVFEDYMAGPVPDDEENYNLLTIKCRPKADVPVWAFDPIKHGIPYMEAQRRMKIRISDLMDEPISIVGGNILLTEITREGVSQRVIHHWNDQIGEPIEPEPFRADQPDIGRLSRAERRRLEKAARVKERVR